MVLNFEQLNFPTADGQRHRVIECDVVLFDFLLPPVTRCEIDEF